MCGLTGVALTADAVDAGVLARMRDAMKHRGPDATGIWCSERGNVGLAHRRLAIIDLTPAANQPMSDTEGSLHIVFNGEIYNYLELAAELQGSGHRFRTASDTEVILEAYRAWGEDCPSRLVGMFSFAIYDTRLDRLFIARDRAGEKPLYYRRSRGALEFASESKALLARPGVPRELDGEALECYLAYGFVPGERSMLRGIRRLPPGHALSYEPANDSLRVWRYWDLPQPTIDPAASADNLTDELERLLEGSVRGQMIADVPVGILLSGGIDSSLITAVAARVSSKPVHTFTVTFPGHARFDEAAHARLVADRFGTLHTEIPAEPATVELLPDLAAQYDDPIADSSMVPTYLVSRAIRRSATVALGGDGGDELFGGYQPYRWVLQQEAVGRFVPRRVQRRIGAVVEQLLPVGFKGRNYLLAATSEPTRTIANLRTFFDREARSRLLGRAATERPETVLAAAHPATATLVQRLTATDFRTYLPDDILVKVDRASMLTSLEVRAPLLDHRVIEFAFGRVPDHLKVTAHGRKILLRRLARRLLPSEFDVNRKQGFSVPLSRWWRGDWGPFFREVLADAPSDLFDPGEIRRLFDAQQRGLGHMHRLFALTMFELWRRHYGVAV